MLKIKKKKQNKTKQNKKQQQQQKTFSRKKGEVRPPRPPVNPRMLENNMKINTTKLYVTGHRSLSVNNVTVARFLLDNGVEMASKRRSLFL